MKLARFLDTVYYHYAVVLLAACFEDKPETKKKNAENSISRNVINCITLKNIPRKIVKESFRGAWEHRFYE